MLIVASQRLAGWAAGVGLSYSTPPTTREEPKLKPPSMSPKASPSAAERVVLSARWPKHLEMLGHRWGAGIEWLIVKLFRWRNEVCLKIVGI